MYYRDYESRDQNMNEIKKIIESVGLAHTISLLAIVAGRCFGETQIYRSIYRISASAEAKRADERIMRLLIHWMGVPRPKDGILHLGERESSD